MKTNLCYLIIFFFNFFFQIVRGCGAPLRRGALCLSNMSTMGSAALFIPFGSIAVRKFYPSEFQLECDGWRVGPTDGLRDGHGLLER